LEGVRLLILYWYNIGVNKKPVLMLPHPLATATSPGTKLVAGRQAGLTLALKDKARTATGMDGTLTLIFGKYETSRDIIKSF
jgi:hypothetical protein